MSRRSLAPGPFQRPGGMASNPSYTLSALQRCVATLQQSDKTQHDLVSEHDIATARAAVAKDAEPQLHTLLERAQDIVLELEAQEQQLMARLQLAKEERERQEQQQATTRSNNNSNNRGGHASDAKRLESLVKRKDELSLTALEIEEVMDQKREEFRVLLVKAQQPGPGGNGGRGAANAGGAFGSGKRTKRNPTNVTVPWTKYRDHFTFLENVLNSEVKTDARDKEPLEEAFERLMSNYTREIETRMSMSEKESARLKKDKMRKVSQMRNLCKQLFPSDNIGQTMVRVLELLTENSQLEVYHKDLVQNEFPPEEERRHNLGRVITILKQVGVIELVLESRVEETGEQTLAAQDEGQLILRIRFDD
ncbi:hypothetical protein BGZ59_011350 [Podila verticillata]|nr:hypothetical protein BGZ59_011350 [Podila verticillata]